VPAFTFVETLAEPSFNVNPSNMLLQGTLRAISLAYKELGGKLQALITGLKSSFNCEIDFEISAHYRSLLNDASIQEKLSIVQERIFGKTKVIEGEPQLFGEDFAFYSRVVTPQFYFLGA
jgi:amidohydrolase